MVAAEIRLESTGNMESKENHSGGSSMDFTMSGWEFMDQCLFSRQHLIHRGKERSILGIFTRSHDDG